VSSQYGLRLHHRRTMADLSLIPILWRILSVIVVITKMEVYKRVQ
jgi:hypothetical protein